MAKAKTKDVSTASGTQTSQDSNSKDALAILKADHRKVEDLFRKYKTAENENEKSELAMQICRELIVHTKLEEEIFYPACREGGVEDGDLDEAQVEHDGAKIMIA